MSQVLIQIITFALEFLLHEAGKEIDWPATKAAAIASVRAFVPGTRFDDAAAYAAGIFIDLIAKYMSDGLGLKDAAKAAKKDLPVFAPRVRRAKKNG